MLIVMDENVYSLDYVSHSKRVFHGYDWNRSVCILGALSCLHRRSSSNDRWCDVMRWVRCTWTLYSSFCRPISRTPDFRKLNACGSEQDLFPTLKGNHLSPLFSDARTTTAESQTGSWPQRRCSPSIPVHESTTRRVPSDADEPDEGV